MDWYDTFNAVEAALWLIVATVIAVRTPGSTGQQRTAVWMAVLAFVAFGLTDLLEIGCAGSIPCWLWVSKIACGTAILSARYTWSGWTTFRWYDREFLFGVGCLIAVGVVVIVQRMLAQK